MGSQFLYPRLPHLNRAVINFAASGNNTVIAAHATKRILIDRIWLVCAGATNLTFVDNLTDPAAVPMSANGGITFDTTGEPWFVTDPATAFIINSSAAVQVSGCAYYHLDL